MEVEEGEDVVEEEEVVEGEKRRGWNGWIAVGY